MPTPTLTIEERTNIDQGPWFARLSEPLRQGILDSWPHALDDSAARRDWDWRARYSLDAMTDDLVPKIRAMLSA